MKKSISKQSKIFDFTSSIITEMLLIEKQRQLNGLVVQIENCHNFDNCNMIK